MVLTAYVTLHVAITAGLDLRARHDFHDAPARAAAFVAALDRYGAGDASERADILEGEAWFKENARSGESRSAVSSSAGSVEKGDLPAAREQAGNLAEKAEHDQAALDDELDSLDAATLWLALATGVFAVPALWLRRRRRARASEVAELVSHFAPRRPWWWRPAFLAASASGYMLFTTGLLATSAAQRQKSTFTMPLVVQVLLVPVGLVALGAGFLILRYSRPRSARGAARALLADGRQPVLYLRSFADDHTSAQVDDGVALNIHSREEQLAGTLRAFGPVIAVGRPGEPLPHLGAARFYLPLDDWQPVILQLMYLSRFIVLRVGVGEGLWWELGQAIATQPPGKLILLTPGQPAGVAERLDQLLPIPARLETVSAGDPWISTAIAFGPGWMPHVHPVKTAPGTDGARGKGVRAAIRATLGPTSVASSARRAAGAMKDALASVGVRGRMVVMRADTGQLATLGKGFLAAAALALAFRAVQLAAAIR